MKVVYRKPINEVITDAIDDAKRNNKIIDKILLDSYEMDEFSKFMRAVYYYSSPACTFLTEKGWKYFGVRVILDDKI